MIWVIRMYDAYRLTYVNVTNISIEIVLLNISKKQPYIHKKLISIHSCQIRQPLTK